MSLPMLAVDKNIELSIKIQAKWDKRGISTVRVDTMQEAIDKLSREAFLFTAINADNINYLHLLRIMADVSSPILIITSNFTVRDQTEAFRHGADGYAPFNDDINENIESALALLQRCSERGKTPKRPPRTVARGNLTIYYDYHQVFCDDAEINLTKKEFDILHYFLSNPNIRLTYKNISRKVWGLGYEDVSHNSIWQHIIKLRKKLTKANFNGGDIINIWDVGYRFVPQYPNII